MQSILTCDTCHWHFDVQTQAKMSTQHVVIVTQVPLFILFFVKKYVTHTNLVKK